MFICIFAIVLTVNNIAIMRKFKKKGNYIALNRKNNDIINCTSRQAIADFLNIHYTTVYRHLIKSAEYHCENYSIWCNIPLQKIDRNINNLPRYREY